MFIKTKGLRTYYENDGQGEFILILHGWGGMYESIKPIFDLLKNNFCVYGIDLPGFGRSEIPEGGWQTSDYGLFIKEFLDNLGIKKVDLVGHSFGGKIGMWFSSHYPEMVRRLVLIDSSGIKPRRKPSYYFKVLLAKIAKKLLPETLKEMVYKKIGSSDYKSAGRMKPTLIKILKDDLKPHLSKILAPTLIICGEKDDQTSIYQAKIMEKEIRNSKLVIIKNAGHFSYLDNFPDFSYALLDFLIRHC